MKKYSNKSVIFLRSNPISPDPRVEKEAAILSGAGYKVYVLGWDRSASLPSHEIFDNYDLFRLPIQAKYGSGIINFPHILRWLLGLFKWLVVHRHDYDLIHSCDFDTILPALLIKLIWNKVVVYDIFDFYSDFLRRTPTWIRKLIRRADLFAINKADAVIIADSSRYGQIKDSLPKRLIVINNSPHDVFRESKQKNLRPLQSEFHLAYVGLLQVERGLLEILEIISLHPKWSMAIAGYGGDQDKILSIAKDLSNVTWHGRVSYTKALDLNASADILFATYDPNIPNHQYASPNKVYEAMMLGKPCIVAYNTNVDKIIQQANCGIIVPYGDKEALELAMYRLAKDPVLRQRLGKNARLTYEVQYNYETSKTALLALYTDLVC